MGFRCVAPRISDAAFCVYGLGCRMCVAWDGVVLETNSPLILTMYLCLPPCGFGVLEIVDNNNGFKVRFGVRRRHWGPPWVIISP